MTCNVTELRHHIAAEFIAQKSHQRMERIAEKVRLSFATDPIANGRPV